MTWTQMETAAQDCRKWKICSQMEPTREAKARQTKELMVKIHRGRGRGRTGELDPDGDGRHAIRWNPQGK
jgi:hypothetical protein